MSVLSQKKLEPPRIIDVLWGALVLAWPSRRVKQVAISLPNALGEYVLEYQIKKADHQEDMTIGVYRKNGKRYIVKHWQGSRKDLNYFFLAHEYFVTKIISRLLTEHPYDGVAVPAAVEFFDGSESFSVVFEFIEGKTLDTVNEEEQAFLWRKANAALEYITPFLTLRERQVVGARGLFFYLAIAGIISILLFLLRPRQGLVLMRTWKVMMRSMKEVNHDALVLAHRDLTASNLLVHPSGKVYILDLEALVLTLRDYDLAYVSVDPKSPTLGQSLVPDTLSAGLIFLRHYIVLHHILGSGEYLKVNEKYLDILRSFHEK